MNDDPSQAPDMKAATTGSDPSPALAGNDQAPSVLMTPDSSQNAAMTTLATAPSPQMPLLAQQPTQQPTQQPSLWKSILAGALVGMAHGAAGKNFASGMALGAV